MIISQQHRFIYIAIPRTATTSISAALKPYGTLYTGYPNWVPGVSWMHQQDNRHSMAKIAMRHHPQEWASFFSFTFVRNPWTRLLSWYALKPQGKATFLEYLKWRQRQPGWLQMEHTHSEEGKPLVDFIGRFENLRADFDEACLHAGLPMMELPHKNGATYTPDTVYDDECREFVAEHAAPDIEEFGYTFEG